MSLVLYKTCYDYAEAIVTASALEAGGYHPTIGNFHYSTMMVLDVQAMGGMQIWLPDHEVEEADEWLAYISEHPIDDYDEIPRRPFGRWFQVSTLSGFGTMGIGGVPFLPLYFIAPLILFFIGIIAAIAGAMTKSSFLIWLSIIILPFSLIFIHAKYVAGQKFIKEDNAHVA